MKSLYKGIFHILVITSLFLFITPLFAQSCAADQWQCADGVQCIPSSYYCDGSNENGNASWGPDCADGSDEIKDTCCAIGGVYDDNACGGGTPTDTTCTSDLPPVECNTAGGFWDFGMCNCGGTGCTQYMTGPTCDTVPECWWDGMYCMTVVDPGGEPGEPGEPGGDDSCGSGQWQCADGVQCIPSSYYCDGSNENGNASWGPDCADGSDEIKENCCDEHAEQYHTGICGGADCGAGNFSCNNGECIPEANKCNGTSDCSDGSDEMDCGNYACDWDEFHCNNNECIPEGWKCNGYPDCDDGSDEVDCDDGGEELHGCNLPMHTIYLTNNGVVLYNSPDSIGGFQFTINGATVSSPWGGDAGGNGFIVTVNATGAVLGYSVAGSSIPPGCGTLTEFYLNGDATGLSSIVFTDPTGTNSLPFVYFSQCADGTILDCSGDGDCCALGWVGDGYCDGGDQPAGCDLTCYDNDGGDCVGGGTGGDEIFCGTGYVVGCGFGGDCIEEFRIGDGYCDGMDAQYGVNLCCHNNDGGDCSDAQCGGGNCNPDCADACGDINNDGNIDTADYPVQSPGPNSGCGCYCDCNGNGGYDSSPPNTPGYEGEPCFDLYVDEGPSTFFCADYGFFGDQVGCDADPNCHWKWDDGICVEGAGSNDWWGDIDSCWNAIPITVGNTYTVDRLTLNGGLNEIFMGWDPVNSSGISYNIYRNCEFVGNLDSTVYVDDGTFGNSIGWGLGFDAKYCYGITAVDANGTESAVGEVVCAKTLPQLQAFLQVDASLANPVAAAAACQAGQNPLGDIINNSTGAPGPDGVCDGVGLLMVKIVNLLPIGGYQFNVNLNSAALSLGTLIDANYLMTGGTGGLENAQVTPGAVSNGIAMAYSLQGRTIPASTEGQLLAVLVLNHPGWPASTTAIDEEVTVTISNISIAGSYNGETITVSTCATMVPILDPNWVGGSAGTLADCPSSSTTFCHGTQCGEDCGTYYSEWDCEGHAHCDWNGNYCEKGGPPDCLADCPGIDTVDGDNMIEVCTFLNATWDTACTSDCTSADPKYQELEMMAYMCVGCMAADPTGALCVELLDDEGNCDGCDCGDSTSACFASCCDSSCPNCYCGGPPLDCWASEGGNCCHEQGGGDQDGPPACLAGCPGINAVDGENAVSICTFFAGITVGTGCASTCAGDELNELQTMAMMCTGCLAEEAANPGTCAEWLNLEKGGGGYCEDGSMPDCNGVCGGYSWDCFEYYCDPCGLCDHNPNNDCISDNFNFTSSNWGETYCPGDTVSFAWNGGAPNWSVNLTLIDMNMGEDGTSCGAFAWNISNSGSFTWLVPASGQINADCQLQDGNEYQIYIHKYQDTYPYAYGPTFMYDADCMYTNEGGPPPCMEDCVASDGTSFWEIFAPDSSAAFSNSMACSWTTNVWASGAAIDTTGAVDGCAADCDEYEKKKLKLFSYQCTGCLAEETTSGGDPDACECWMDWGDEQNQGNDDCGQYDVTECNICKHCKWDAAASNCIHDEYDCGQYTGYGHEVCEGYDKCTWNGYDQECVHNYQSCGSDGADQEGPPVCLNDCTGYANINHNDAMEVCLWYNSNWGTACTNDCESDVDYCEMERMVYMCDGCLEAEQNNPGACSEWLMFGENANFCKDDEFTCTDGECISQNLECNGTHDCNDGSDESYCGNYCEFNQFSCGNGNCIDNWQVCDGWNDCGNGADEGDCGNVVNCDEFYYNECNQHPDECYWNGYEQKCRHHGEGEWADVDTTGVDTTSYIVECAASQYFCYNGECIDSAKVCDGIPNDCSDNSDEMWCEDTMITCGAQERVDCSGDGDCCDESWIGDGWGDCADQAYGCDLTCYDNDGGDCGSTCPSDKVQCWDGSCAASEASCPAQSESDTSIVALTINLTNGWNIISFNQAPESIDMENILGDLMTNGGSLVKVQDETGSAIEYVSFLSSWINNIGNMLSTEGYYVKVNTASSVTVSGEGTNLPLEIALTNGWNIISYPAQNAQDANNVLQSLMDAGSLVKVQDETGSAIEYVSFLSSWINNINNFEPGEGYYVKVNQATTLSIDEATSVSRIAHTEEKIEPVHFHAEYHGNPYLPMNLYIVDVSLDGNPVGHGVEVGIYDNDICVGSSVLTKSLEDEISYLSLIVGRDDPTTDIIDGYIPGNQIDVRIFDGEKEHKANTGGLVFETQGTAVMSLDAITIPEMYKLYASYPNPFNPTTTISYDLANPGEVSLVVYNILGRIVTTLISGYQEAGFYNITWDADSELASGVYLIKLQAGDYMKINKSILLK